MAHLSWSSVRE